MNRIRIPPLKPVPSSQHVDGTSELPGPTASVIISPASSRNRKRNAGSKAMPQLGCRSVAVRTEHLLGSSSLPEVPVVAAPGRRFVDFRSNRPNGTNHPETNGTSFLCPHEALNCFCWKPTQENVPASLCVRVQRARTLARALLRAGFHAHQMPAPVQRVG
jgi:hypothetical protein